MNFKILIGGLVVVVVLVVAVPFLSGGGGDTAPAEPTPAQQDAPALDATDTGVAPPQATPPAAPAAPSGPQLTAESLVNTTWQYQGFQITLLPNGVAQANTPFGQVQGTWSVSGNTLTASAMGQSVTAQIQGNQLIANGQPLQRLN